MQPSRLFSQRAILSRCAGRISRDNYGDRTAMEFHEGYHNINHQIPIALLKSLKPQISTPHPCPATPASSPSFCFPSPQPIFSSNDRSAFYHCKGIPSTPITLPTNGFGERHERDCVVQLGRWFCGEKRRRGREGLKEGFELFVRQVHTQLKESCGILVGDFWFG